MREFSTPMMKQYMEIKQQYADCLLFFRLGDFYELFLDDAIIGAKILGITLTKRPRGKDGDIPMAGVPYHASDSYIAKLIRAGHKVAICEQVSQPNSRGIVDREVIRIITPGTVLDEKTLEQKHHNYTMSICFGKKSLGIAVADVSTGDFQVTELEITNDAAQLIANEVARFEPAECIISPHDYNTPERLGYVSMRNTMSVYPFNAWDEYIDEAAKHIQRHFQIASLTSFNLSEKKEATKAAAALLGYLGHTQRQPVRHIRTLKTYVPDEHLVMDQATIANLELFSTIRTRDQHGSFVDGIDHTSTAMGGRMLREWVRKPLITRHTIKERLDAVEELVSERSLRQTLREYLEHIYDIERVLARLTVRLGTPSDLIRLKSSLLAVLAIKQQLSTANAPLLISIEEGVSESIQSLVQYIERRIYDDAPVDPKNGGVIKPNVSVELDSIRSKVSDGKGWIAKLESQERSSTAITSLKVRFNKVFGYYIEVSKPNPHLVPDRYIRRQSTINAERFITPELKRHEEIILAAEDRLLKTETELFEETVQHVLSHTDDLQQVSANMAALDCLVGFAELAEQDRYCKPKVVTTGEIRIDDGRHPVVEKSLQDEQFVPNDTLLNTSDHQLLILTGPNMAGKSVYMRQVAIITLMAHIGMFVPARKAIISIVDRIFVRSGASDAIGSGLSTFMVEMVETAHILHHATSKSLIIMDEIGRGTSTYDGISIAWAVAEYLVTHTKHAPKTLFATHYHELQMLEDQYLDRIKNFQVMVEEHKGKPVFLHKVAQGRSSHSYAVAVAKLAGVPEEVTKRALDMLSLLEKREFNKEGDTLISKKLTDTIHTHGNH